MQLLNHLGTYIDDSKNRSDFLLKKINNNGFEPTAMNKNEVMKIGTVHDLKLKYSLVPRKFFIEDNDLGLNRFDKCEDQKMTFNEINGSKLIILSDHANSGKSVTFKYFATRMKEHKKLCWVSYIDLKSYRRLFDLFVDKEMRVEDCYDILFNSIGIKSQFEASILRKFLINGQAILFLDIASY